MDLTDILENLVWCLRKFEVVLRNIIACRRRCYFVLRTKALLNHVEIVPRYNLRVVGSTPTRATSQQPWTSLIPMIRSLEYDQRRAPYSGQGEQMSKASRNER